MQYINFQNRNFPIKEIEISTSTFVFISTTDLNSLLMTESGNYTSKEAELIDQEIYYFVELDQLSLPNYKLIKLIAKETNA